MPLDRDCWRSLAWEVTPERGSSYQALWMCDDPPETISDETLRRETSKSIDEIAEQVLRMIAAGIFPQDAIEIAGECWAAGKNDYT